MNFAVVSHFDANNHFEQNFLDLLKCLNEVFDRIILVTTSDPDEHHAAIPGNVTIIKRPNVGYDFYSYRVGILAALKTGDVDNILLVNSSIVLVDENKFVNLLKEMVEQSRVADVVGVTSSRQINWHIQSYMLLITNVTLFSEWFITFFNKISPANSKIDLILRNEIGLSQAFKANGVKTSTMFEPTKSDRAHARKLWLSHMSPTSRKVSWRFLRELLEVRKINHTHFSAQAIAERFGFVKGELIRTNPHNLDLQFLDKIASVQRRVQIDLMIRSSKSHYKKGVDNITILAAKNSPIPDARRICYGIPNKIGVKIAVVLHLYYIDIINEMFLYLKNVIEPFDLFVTTPFEADVPTIINTFSSLAESVSVFVSENRGRDIGPFVHVYRTGSLDHYAAVLKIHSKKSKYSKNGALWRDEIFKKLIGDSLTVRRSLRLFDSPKIGIVGPNPYYLTNENYWGANRIKVVRLLAAMRLIQPDEEPPLGFFAGSMFWFNPRALMALKAVPENELLFEAEAGMQDGTMAHALERAFGPMTRRSGFVTTSLVLNGDEINDIDSMRNIVPVL